ncbi:hypothetical protein ACFQE5_01935 [Pseudonocardia hispaniensis]|uniref:Uncharacterized protein n=1 Tax=Pseudonocardia hispaniensis TaxID=904933 RepID=A0ABW1IWX5_9PSEU
MAEIFPDEGLDYLLGIVPKGGAAPTDLYLFLFTSQTASTVPAADAVLATETGVTEAAFPGYARVAVDAADWGAAGADTIWSQAVRAVTAEQKAFPQATGADPTAINGFGLATAATGGVAVFYSNFDDETAIPGVALGDTIKVTPKFGLGG